MCISQRIINESLFQLTPEIPILSEEGSKLIEKEQKEFWALASLNLKIDLDNSIFIDDNFKIVNSAAKAGVGQVYWINPGRHKVLSNGVKTYPSLKALIDTIL